MCKNLLNITRFISYFISAFVYFQASEVSRTRGGVSLLARPGNSLVAAIRSQSQQEPVPLGLFKPHILKHIYFRQN